MFWFHHWVSYYSFSMTDDYACLYDWSWCDLAWHGLVFNRFFCVCCGAKIDPKPCNPRSLQKPKRSNSYPKVFLGGLPSNITETDLRTYFTRFGKVMEVVIMYDQEKKKSRGEWERMCAVICQDSGSHIIP